MKKKMQGWNDLTEKQKGSIRKEFKNWTDHELKKLLWYKTKDGKWSGRASSNYLAPIFGIPVKKK